MGLADALIARIDTLIRARLDAAISSRLAASSYVAPDNAAIGLIKARTDLIPGVGVPSVADYSAARALKLDNLDALISSRAAPADVSPGVDVRMNLAVPANPTADSVYERLKALDDNYTAARAALLDNLNATISSRASATDYTASRALKLDNLDALISSRATAADVWAAATRTLTASPSPIVSIQTGYVGGTGATGSGEDYRYIDVVISAVDMAKAVVLLQGKADGTMNTTARLLSSTVLRVGQSVSSAAVAGRWTVVEFT